MEASPVAEMNSICLRFALARAENDQHYSGLENGGQGVRHHLQLIASQARQYSIDFFEFSSTFCVTSISFNTIPSHRISPLVAG